LWLVTWAVREPDIEFPDAGESHDGPHTLLRTSTMATDVALDTTIVGLSILTY
jgi:hypothetical protein